MPQRKLPSGSGNTQLALSPELSLAAIGLFSAFADGESLDDSEAYALDQMLASIELYEDYSDEDFKALGGELGQLLRSEGFESVVGQAIATVKEEELEEDAFIVSLGILVSDGEIPEEEKEYIDNLRQALGLSKKRAIEIVDEMFSDEEEEESEDEEEE